MKQRDSIVPIEYHADDFALFPEQSRRIISCHQNGRLNGVSAMPNSEYLAECMALLRPHQEHIAITVHLNIMEGRSLCAPQEIPMLVDSQGVFRGSFGGLLLRSCLPGRRACREQLKKELRAQIAAVAPYYADGMPLRIDGHAHYHMLPVVFDALMEVLQEENRKVSYIRFPREHPMVYLRHWKQLQNFAPINLVKVILLNLLACRNRIKYRDYLGKLEQRLFLGVFLSGSMYHENVAAVLPDAIRLAQKRNCGIEILAHPGGVYEEGDIAQLTNGDDIRFLTSEARQKERTLFVKEEAQENGGEKSELFAGSI